MYWVTTLDKMKTKIKIHKTKAPEVFLPASANYQTDYFDTSVPAGFPSPALDAIQKKLDLNEYVIEHPAATFFVRVQGDSMQDADIHTGDILVVDKALEAKHRDIVLAVVDGEFTVKRFCKTSEGVFLQPENNEYKSIKITEEMDFQVWGVVRAVVKKFK